MKAGDLRIGNYFVGAHESNVPILQVKSFYENGVHSGMGKTHNFNLCLPIPLTEGWLIDFKLEMEGRYTYLFGNIRFSYYADGYLYEQIIIPGSGQTLQYGKRIEFVHNFQNRVHSLTGKELTK